jgi:ribose-phosphate pyrophosphokinase
VIVIEGPGGNGIGKRISTILNSEFVKATHKVFPDGESEIEISSDIKGKDVILVHSLYPNQDTRIFELLLMADEVRRARSITAVVPYLAYARENKRFLGKDNAVSLDTLLWLMRAVGIRRLVTISPHATNFSAFGGEVDVIDVVPALAKKLQDLAKNIIVLAPDEGALGLARNFADKLGCLYTYLSKSRDGKTGEVSIVKTSSVDLKGKRVIIVDDMISTGGTMAQAAKYARDKGARSVVAVAAHLLMVDGANDRLADAGISEIYGTNSVVCKGAYVIDVSEAVAKAIREKT